MFVSPLLEKVEVCLSNRWRSRCTVTGSFLAHNLAKYAFSILPAREGKYVKHLSKLTQLPIGSNYQLSFSIGWKLWNINTFTFLFLRNTKCFHIIPIECQVYVMPSIISVFPKLLYYIIKYPKIIDIHKYFILSIWLSLLSYSAQFCRSNHELPKYKLKAKISHSRLLAQVSKLID